MTPAHSTCLARFSPSLISFSVNDSPHSTHLSCLCGAFLPIRSSQFSLALRSGPDSGYLRFIVTPALPIFGACLQRNQANHPCLSSRETSMPTRDRKTALQSGVQLNGVSVDKLFASMPPSLIARRHRRHDFPLTDHLVLVASNHPTFG